MLPGTQGSTKPLPKNMETEYHLYNSLVMLKMEKHYGKTFTMENIVSLANGIVFKQSTL